MQSVVATMSVVTAYALRQTAQKAKSIDSKFERCLKFCKDAAEEGYMSVTFVISKITSSIPEQETIAKRLNQLGFHVNLTSIQTGSDGYLQYHKQEAYVSWAP